MKKKLLTIICFTALLLVGCGQTQVPPTSSSQTTAESGETVTEQSGQTSSNPMSDPNIQNEIIKLEVKSISATSQLNDTADKTYSPSNLIDGNPATAYVEGAEGTGVGESLTFQFGLTPYYITEIVWAPGYQASEDLLEKNGYPTDLTFKTEEVSHGIEAVPSPLCIGSTVTFALPEPMYVDADGVEMIIENAEAGTTYEDTCISEMEFYGYVAP